MTDPRLARPLWRGRTNVDALTIACIEHAEVIARQIAPDVAHEFVITQGSYQAGAGDPNSKGTHDKGGVVDSAWCGHPICVRAQRLAGMAAWHRTPAQGPWKDHIHAVVIGHPILADSAHRQVIAYIAGRNGLKNDGADDGPRFDPIPRPVWPWPEEDTVTPDDIKAIATETTKQLLGANVAKDGPTVRAALRMASKAAGMEDRVAARVGQLLLDGTDQPSAVTVTAEQIEAAVKQALREGTGD